MKRAVVLLSGGLDSATILYDAKNKKYVPSCLIFDYGQRHGKEIKQAVQIAQSAACDYHIMRINFPWQGSSLLDASQPLPQCRKINHKEIPSTYVPARNIIFLSFAASYAEAVNAQAIFIGANAVDYSGYPDCRPSFFQAFQKTLNLGLKTGVEGRRIKIITPLLRKTKAQIIKMGLRLGVLYELTWSCYSGGKKPCGICDSCLLRQKGFEEAGVPDPLLGQPDTPSRFSQRKSKL